MILLLHRKKIITTWYITPLMLIGHLARKAKVNRGIRRQARFMQHLYRWAICTENLQCMPSIQVEEGRRGLCSITIAGLCARKILSARPAFKLKKAGEVYAASLSLGYVRGKS
jgi:hypothetical protein